MIKIIFNECTKCDEQKDTYCSFYKGFYCSKCSNCPKDDCPQCKAPDLLIDVKDDVKLKDVGPGQHQHD